MRGWRQKTEEGEVRATQFPSSRMGLLHSSSVTGQVATSESPYSSGPFKSWGNLPRVPRNLKLCDQWSKCFKGSKVYEIQHIAPVVVTGSISSHALVSKVQVTAEEGFVSTTTALDSESLADSVLSPWFSSLGWHSWHTYSLTLLSQTLQNTSRRNGQGCQSSSVGKGTCHQTQGA